MVAYSWPDRKHDPPRRCVRRTQIEQILKNLTNQLQTLTQQIQEYQVCLMHECSVTVNLGFGGSACALDAACIIVQHHHPCSSCFAHLPHALQTKYNIQVQRPGAAMQPVADNGAAKQSTGVLAM